MRTPFLTALASAALCAAATSPSAVAQADPSLARNLAATCANCHGTGGIAQPGPVFALAGKPKAEIVAKVQEFRDGKRASTIMQQLAKGYSDEQIELIAGWFAAQKTQ